MAGARKQLMFKNKKIFSRDASCTSSPSCLGQTSRKNRDTQHLCVLTPAPYTTPPETTLPPFPRPSPSTPTPLPGKGLAGAPPPWPNPLEIFCTLPTTTTHQPTGFCAVFVFSGFNQH